MDDIATALTDSLSRSGLGGMLVPFENSDGSKIAPGMTWVNEPTSGWYRKANNEFWYSVGNDDVFQITKTGISIAPGKTATGISSKITIQDAEPTGLSAGEQWFESDDGGLYMRYQNPDLTYTWILVNAVGGDFLADAPSDGKTYARKSGAWVSVLDEVYPVGAIYLSLNATDPGTLFGGTWSAIGAGRMLIGVGTLGSDTYVAGATGGAASVTLTAAQLPVHDHGVPNVTNLSAGVGSATIASLGSYMTNFSTVQDGSLPNAPGGGAHENRPPYLAVYMFQRTA
jgi:hypothetical protein